MARNEEKQQGRLNRLWLQKEREDGRLKDTRESRPKLCTLNTAASVKKWIPSIKNEIEYCLQQSQLTHYPERKIAEFQHKIEALEKEYKSFITKLRVLDPLCKHHPWTPRGYCKRRMDKQDLHSPVKKPFGTLAEHSDICTEDNSGGTSTYQTNLKTRTTDTLSQSDSRTINQVQSNLDIIDADQDLPLSFNQSRLAVAVAPFRGSSPALVLTQSNSLARVLQSGLPNLGNSAKRYLNHLTPKDKTQTQIVESAQSERSDEYSVSSQEEPQTATEKPVTGTSLTSGCPAEGGHVLGLDCYSSTDDEES